MTTIFKMSDQENITPTFEHVERLTVATRNEEAGRKMAATLSEAGLTDEMDMIETCALSGRNYAYNADWPADQVAQLREYAAVVGLKGSMLPVRTAAAPEAVVDDPEMQKLSAAAESAKPRASNELSLAAGDPFHIAEASDKPKAKDDWEKVTPGRKMASTPEMNVMTAGIMPIRGEFEYEKQQQLRVRRGENSLANPDAIGAFAKEQDTGERLREENDNLRTERKAAKTAWQHEVVQTAKDLGVGSLPRGKVFMTGSIPEKQAQTDLAPKQASEELSKMDSTIPALPDLTDGEKIRQTNADRRAEIQRKAVADDWQKVRGSTRPSLDDAFSDALECQLNNSGIKVATASVVPQQVTKTASKASTPAVSQPVKKHVTSGTEEQSEAFAAALESQLLKAGIKA